MSYHWQRSPPACAPAYLESQDLACSVPVGFIFLGSAKILEAALVPQPTMQHLQVLSCLGFALSQATAGCTSALCTQHQRDLSGLVEEYNGLWV